GSYGVYWEGSSTSEGNVIEDNDFINPFYIGIYLYRLVRPLIHDNYITSLNTSNSFNGIYGYQCPQGITITSNSIVLPGKKGIGIQINGTHGTSSNRSLIANNFVTLGNSTNSYGLYQAGSNYLDIIHNTVRIGGGNTSGTAYYKTSGTNTQVYNNIFFNEVGGYAMYVTSTASPFTSDYNDLFTTGTNLTRFGSISY